MQFLPKQDTQRALNQPNNLGIIKSREIIWEFLIIWELLSPAKIFPLLALSLGTW